MSKLTVINDSEILLGIETNTSIEITGTNPPPRAGIRDVLSIGDILTLDSGRDVRIIIRDGAIAILV